MIAVFVPAALLVVLLVALFVAVWGFALILCRAGAMEDRRLEEAFDRAFPRDDDRPLLTLIDSERDRP
jgi:protein-S-isoprenylcysteine O-methyltransferase Ste14